jgi:DNA-directed RNA polymerase subunit RPC12/RpoP
MKYKNLKYLSIVGNCSGIRCKDCYFHILVKGKKSFDCEMKRGDVKEQAKQLIRKYKLKRILK